MFIRKVFYLLSMISALLYLFGCSVNTDNKSQNQIFSGVFKSGHDSGIRYEITGNPLINADAYDFTSDPAVCVINDKSSGQEVLMMVTSSDYRDNGGSNFKMDKTYLFTTVGEDLAGTVNDPVYWYGPGDPVINEDDIPWVHNSPKRLYAPDIQFRKYEGSDDDNRGIYGDRIYIFVPDIDNTDFQRIAVAYTDSNADSLYGDFTIDNDYLNIKGSSVPNGGYAYDPGICYDEESGEYYMAYCNTTYEEFISKNRSNPISIIKLNKNMKEADYINHITFKNKDLSKVYMEGPDINLMKTPDGTRLYYLTFAAKVKSNETEYIGYATATPEEFRNDPANCWNFKGWIFKHLNAGDWTNHSDLIQYKEKYYVFYHRTFPGNTARQVCCKEFEIGNDGKIVGVDQNESGSLDGRVKSITKGFVNIKDEGINEGNITKPRFSSLKNITGKTLYGPRLYYYLDIEPGKNLVIDNYYLSNGYTSLEHIGSKTWAVVLNVYGGITFNPGDTLTYEDVFGIHYEDWSTFNKTNDYSQPLRNENTWTTRVALKDYEGNLVCGEIPDVPYDTTKYISSEYETWDHKRSYLTCTTKNENEGINSQFLNTGWTKQEWYVYNLSDVKDGNGNILPAVRIKNLESGYYMTCNDQLKNNSYYWLLSQKLKEDWKTQIWIKEDMGYGAIRLRCYWKPTSGALKNKDIYLTVQGAGDKIDIYVQSLGDDRYPTQRWRID